MAEHESPINFIELVSSSTELPVPSFFSRPYEFDEYPLSDIPGVLTNALGKRFISPPIATIQIESALTPLESPSKVIRERQGVIAQRADDYLHSNGFMDSLSKEEMGSGVIFTSSEIGSVGDE